MITPKMKKIEKGKRGETPLQREVKNRVKNIQETGKDPEEEKVLVLYQMKKQIDLCLEKGDPKGLDPETEEEEEVGHEIDVVKGDLFLGTDVEGYRGNHLEDLGLGVDHVQENILDERMADQSPDPEAD